MNQADILAQNEQLTASLTARTSELAIAQSEVTRLTGSESALTASFLSANASILALTGERDAARLEATSAQAATVAANALVAIHASENTSLKGEVTSLTGKLVDFNKKLAGELSKHGIRAAAIDAPSIGADGNKLTATERVNAVKGK